MKPPGTSDRVTNPSAVFSNVTTICGPQVDVRSRKGTSRRPPGASWSNQARGSSLALPVVTFPPDPQLDDLVRKHMTFPHQILSLEEASRLGGGAAEVLRYANRRYGATDVVAYDRRAFSVGGIFIHRHGPLWAAVQRIPAVLHPGTAAMFECQGFKATGVIQPTRRKLPMSRLVMEPTVRGRRANRPRGKSS